MDDLTAQYWQAVYRSVSGTQDVLTLYMCTPYINSARFSSSGGDYTNSTLRTTPLNTYNTLEGIYSNLDTYTVAPYQLSSF